MALDEPGNDEKTIIINGLDVLIEDTVRPLTDGNKLDYVTEPQGEGFVLAPVNGSSCDSSCC